MWKVKCRVNGTPTYMIRPDDISRIEQLNSEMRFKYC